MYRNGMTCSLTVWSRHGPEDTLIPNTAHASGHQEHSDANHDACAQSSGTMVIAKHGSIGCHQLSANLASHVGR